jgi:S-adenosylmethionine synthetase
MKRYSETVLNGHPDKFCDIVADRIIREAYRFDPGAYAQIEVAVWSDHIFLTGALVTKHETGIGLRDVIVRVGDEIGYTPGNHIDVRRYTIHDHVCRLTGDPGKWTRFVNDQCIITGYAGYDHKTRFLPPEHFVSWYFRESLITAMQNGVLKGHGPDGKVLVVIDENGGDWHIRTLLVTLQQKEHHPFMQFTGECFEALQSAYTALQLSDNRWLIPWKDIKVLINPNGPLLNGGSDGDNGQTGRKLVMDYYGPRIPLGGGALYGKDLSHIDRLGSMAARRYALDLVEAGATEVLVKVCYAPGMEEPLDIILQSDVKPHTDPHAFFGFSRMRDMIDTGLLNYNLEQLGTFYNRELAFNEMG